MDRSWFWKGATLGHLGRMERWISGSALYCCSDIASCPPIPLNIWILLQIYIQLKFMSSGVEFWTLLRTLLTKIVCFQLYNTHNLGNYTEILLHQARIFYTCTACGASDKYQVCFTLGAEAAFCRSLVKMDILIFGEIRRRLLVCAIFAFNVGTILRLTSSILLVKMKIEPSQISDPPQKTKNLLCQHLHIL